MAIIGDILGGRNVTELDYYQYEKNQFNDNVMLAEVRTIYINNNMVKSINDYIGFIKIVI